MDSTDHAQEGRNYMRMMTGLEEKKESANNDDGERTVRENGNDEEKKERGKHTLPSIHLMLECGVCSVVEMACEMACIEDNFRAIVVKW